MDNNNEFSIYNIILDGLPNLQNITSEIRINTNNLNNTRLTTFFSEPLIVNDYNDSNSDRDPIVNYNSYHEEYVNNTLYNTQLVDLNNTQLSNYQYNSKSPDIEDKLQESKSDTDEDICNDKQNIKLYKEFISKDVECEYCRVFNSRKNTFLYQEKKICMKCASKLPCKLNEVEDIDDYEDSKMKSCSRGHHFKPKYAFIRNTRRKGIKMVNTCFYCCNKQQLRKNMKNDCKHNKHKK